MSEEEALGYSCVIPEILDLCDQGRDLKQNGSKPEGANGYKEIERKIRTESKMAKRDLDTGSMPGSGSMFQKE